MTGRPEVEDAAAVLRMLDAEFHRGPDDWGLLIPDSLRGTAGLRSLLASRDPGQERVRVYAAPSGGSGAVLGSRRLSIIDLSPRGRMPMSSADGRIWITHNGEVYNCPELRSELEGRVGSFYSSTDTEVILHGYAAWRDGVLSRLRGMFAFALFEAAPRPRLLLARDRLGIKPLYYYRDRERLIFASEVRALLRCGMIPDETNAEALVRFLQLGSVPAPHTTIKNVSALPAGHSLVVGAEVSAPRSYWDLGEVPRRVAVASPDDAVASTRALLEESVGLHLASDVPLGVFLSGGIDSSALVALCSRLRRAPVTTLSIAFEEPAYSEAPYARLVAKRYRTDHREILVRMGDLVDGATRFFAAMDEPTVDGVNTYFISEAAKQAGLTVVLSGTGGDEVFLGYGHLRRAELLHRIRTLLAALPAWARSGLIRAAARGGAALGRTGTEKLHYLERPSAGNLYLVVRGLFGPGRIQDLLGISEAELDAWGPPLTGGGERGRGAVDALGRLELSHYLRDQLLKDTDVMGMAHSVEIRVPYLDHRLVEWVVGLPRAMKLGGGRHKPLLLQAVDGGLPREIWDRPKMGFTFPFPQWMRERAGDLEAQSLEGKLLERRAVEETWRAFRAGRLHWSRAWALVVLARFDAGRKQGLAA